MRKKIKNHGITPSQNCSDLILRIQWRLVFAIAIRYYRLQLWVSYFIYFKITLVFFHWMFFNSIKVTNRLRKEINRLLSKGMSNIYLKVTIEAFLKPLFSRLKNFVTRSVFRELQLTQILNFKTSCCNLKIRSLEAKFCMAFILLF